VNLVLVGYRGSGKTTVGSILAARLGWTFIDLDDVVLKRTGKSIAEIFAQEGEPGFRQREREAIKSLEKVRRHVIALGGGAVTEPNVRVSAKRIGKVVWLRAPAAVLWGRISRDPSTLQNRPDLTPAGGLVEVEEVLRQREPLYRGTANHWVDTFPGTPEAVADSIQTWFEANDATRGG
jgi:shikimate kinase